MRAYEADAAATAAKDREPPEIYDYQTGKLITPEPPALPAPSSPATPTSIARPIAGSGSIERVYDPEDPNADETGHVWLVSLLPFPDAEKLYLCTEGYLR